MSKYLWIGKSYSVQIWYTGRVFLGLQQHLTLHLYVCINNFRKVVHLDVRTIRFRSMYLRVQFIWRVSYGLFQGCSEIFRCKFGIFVIYFGIKRIFIVISCICCILVMICKCVTYILNICLNMCYHIFQLFNMGKGWVWVITCKFGTILDIYITKLCFNWNLVNNI